RELRFTAGEHEGMQSMRHQIAEQTAAIAVVFAPAMEIVRAEGPLGHRAQPPVPIDVLRCALLLDQIIPFSFGIVAAIITLSPDQLTDLAGADEFSRFVPPAGRTTLRTDLENFPGLLDGVVHAEGFIEIARHWFLTI